MYNYSFKSHIRTYSPWQIQKKPAKESPSKIDDLSVNTGSGAGQLLTTNQGLKINDNNNSLKAGERGPTLLEDIILREKTTHFDHERIPERIVHAGGSGAHGIFKRRIRMVAFRNLIRPKPLPTNITKNNGPRHYYSFDNP